MLLNYYEGIYSHETGLYKMGSNKEQILFNKFQRRFLTPVKVSDSVSKIISLYQ